MNFEIYLMFLVKPFMTEKSWQKFKHLEKEKSYK